MISSGRPNVSRFGVTNTATPSGSSTRATSASTRSGSGTCSSDWTDSTDAKPAVRERQRPHVRHDRLAVLAGERLRVEIDADRLARREQVEAVADAAAEVQDAARAELRLGQGIGRDMALPGGIEAACGAGDALTGDLHAEQLGSLPRQ